MEINARLNKPGLFFWNYASKKILAHGEFLVGTDCRRNYHIAFLVVKTLVLKKTKGQGRGERVFLLGECEANEDSIGSTSQEKIPTVPNKLFPSQ